MNNNIKTFGNIQQVQNTCININYKKSRIHSYTYDTVAYISNVTNRNQIMDLSVIVTPWTLFTSD